MSGAKGRRSHPWLFAPQLRSCHSLMKRCDGSISDSKYFSQSTSYHEISVFIPKYSFGQSFPSCSVMYCFWKRWCRRRPRGVELATVPHHELQWRCFCQLWWILPKPLGWMMGNVYRKTSLGLRGFFSLFIGNTKTVFPLTSLPDLNLDLSLSRYFFWSCFFCSEERDQEIEGKVGDQHKPVDGWVCLLLALVSSVYKWSDFGMR